MENKELVLSVPKEIDKSKADQILEAFDPAYLKAKEYEKNVAEVKAMETSPEKCAKAKRLRLDFRAVRTAADKTREKLKEKSLAEGRAIQGVFNILKLSISDNETELLEIETHYERIEQAKIQKIQDKRISELAEFDVDGLNMDLGNMDDIIYSNLLEGSKSKWQAVKDAEKKAEEERIETERLENLYYERKDLLAPYIDFIVPNLLNNKTTEKEFQDILSSAKELKADYQKDQEEIRLENERLKKEAEKAEKARLAEEKKQETKRLEAEKKKEKEDYRQNKMFSLGLKWDGQSFVYKDINFNWTDLVCMSDEDFEKAVTGASERKSALDKEAEDLRLKEEAEAEADRIRIAKEKEDAKKKALAPDKDKLIDLSKTVLSLNVKSELAKETIKKAHEIIISAINKM
jgi:hypothetical protein